jgi:hypothetical protein
MLWKRLVIACCLLAAFLTWTTWMAEGWRRPGDENHTMVYIGIRHQWRRWRQWTVDSYRSVKNCEGSISCVATEFKYSVLKIGRVLTRDGVPKPESEGCQYGDLDCVLDAVNGPL